jgi:hypothetical protein
MKTQNQKKQKNQKWSQLILSLFFVTALFSCKKETKTPVNTAPTNYAEIDIEDIKLVESSMSIASIQATSAEGLEWNIDDVFVYKTNENRFGKLQVIDIFEAEDNKFQFRATVFNADGSVFDTTDSLQIRLSYFCDLDSLIETGNKTTKDFLWSGATEDDTYFNPQNNAKFRGYYF